MADMLAPFRHEHKNVAPFADAFDSCYCPTDGTLLAWQPPEGLPWTDVLSEHPELVEVWYATCAACSVRYRLQWIMQRPSDHTTPYGYVWREDDGDEDGQ